MKIFLFALGIFLLLTILRGRKLLLDPFMRCAVETELYKSTQYEGFEIEASVFKKKNTTANKAILLLPPTGGRNIIDEGYAYMFCKRGFDVVILQSWSGDRGVEDYVLDFGIHQRYMSKTVKAIELVLENMNYNFIGTLGTSAGAINFNTALSKPFVQNKVDAFFNIVGALPLCKILATAGEQGLEKVREARFKEFGFKTMQEYIDKICSVVDLKIPEEKPQGIDFGMIISTKDTTVPYIFQQEQVDKWRPRFLDELDSSHIRTVIKTYLFKRKKVLRFFLESSTK